MMSPNLTVICYRDPADVRTIRRQSLLIILAFAITAIAVVGVVYKSIQRPDRILVDMSSGRTVMINDKELPATEAVNGQFEAFRATVSKSHSSVPTNTKPAQRNG